MKKAPLFALALLVSLPGCCKKQKKAQNKKSRIEQNIDMFSSVEPTDNFAADVFGEEDNLRSFFDFDEDVEGFVPSDEVDLYRNFNIEESDIQDQEYSWVDEGAEEELKPLYFSFNRHGLNETQADVAGKNIEQLKQLLSDAGSDVNPIIVVEGHACQEGAPAYNLALSEKRAKNVADMLVKAGFDQDMIKIVGRGQEVPAIINGKVVDGSREERAPNRRVELRVIYT